MFRIERLPVMKMLKIRYEHGREFRQGGELNEFGSILKVGGATPKS